MAMPGGDESGGFWLDAKTDEFKQVRPSQRANPPMPTLRTAARALAVIQTTLTP